MILEKTQFYFFCEGKQIELSQEEITRWCTIYYPEENTKNKTTDELLEIISKNHGPIYRIET